ncbi:hypothetical protein [Oceanobacillus sp. AG]|uniref:hypothetical protein n=1 Tax=Oceanobacillus sp. AG TaxID=2681969 RepID=UPI0018DD9897|nr:hypothetical protein [Oceanobacillus sp. AG]
MIREGLTINISIIKAAPEHTEEISRICSIGWRQTVQGVYDEEYQAKNVEHWCKLAHYSRSSISN